MIKFDFNTYTTSFIDKNKYDELLAKKSEIITRFNESNMIGWTKKISKDIVSDIKETARNIKDTFDCMVVIGIGGSFLGSYSFDKIFRKYFNDDKFEVIYAGTSLSSKYLDELINYLDKKNFCLTVISKSGSTMETKITYKILKDVLKRKYSEEEIPSHIITITDKENGELRQETEEKGYKSFIIPNNIGGRYSFITPAHLLPLALNYDIDEIINGYYHGKRLIDKAYEYAVIRRILFDKKKQVENFCVNEENLLFYTEWLKQLFGETEGKQRVGIYPTSSLHTRDLHSLGQFVQDGNKILFETFIKVKKVSNYIAYEKKTLHEINNIVEDSVMRAHYKGGVPCLEIEIDEISSENIANLYYFFMLSAAFSGYLFGIEPFNQPGVEVYKQEVRDALTWTK